MQSLPVLTRRGTRRRCTEVNVTLRDAQSRPGIHPLRSRGNDTCWKIARRLSGIKLFGNGLQTAPFGQQVTWNILEMTTKRAVASCAARDKLLFTTE